MAERILQLAVEGEYFHAMLTGEKPEEYREVTPYWIRRLEGKTFDRVILTWGYPSKTDLRRRIELPFVGIVRKTITHKHFDDRTLEVFAIQLGERENWFIWKEAYAATIRHFENLQNA